MNTEPKHSGPGIASCWIVVAGGLVVTILITVGVMIGESKHRGFYSEGSTEATLILCGALLGAVVVLVGLGLGIAGLCQKERRKTYAIWGIVLSLLFPLAPLVGVVAAVAFMSRPPL